MTGTVTVKTITDKSCHGEVDTLVDLVATKGVKIRDLVQVKGII